MEFSLKELSKKYDLELDRVANEIKKSKAKTILLQFPEGLKPYALAVSDEIEEKTGVNVRIWLGSCFGACDLPRSDADLVIQFGHAEWV
jgi:2-(3-amino-3-carboxypropyl)histidine synthase